MGEKYIVPYDELNWEEKWYADLADSIEVQKRLSLEKEVLQTPKIKKISEDRLKKYMLFANRTNKQGINPEAIFMHSGEKRSLLLEIFHLKKLKTKGGRTPIDECSDSQVGQVFRDYYRRAINQ